MSSSQQPLAEMSIRNFQPMTSNTDPLKKKMELSEALKNKMDAKELRDATERCRSKKLSVFIIFRLWQDDSGKSPDTRIKKDLDNLLKIPLDAIKTHVDDQEKHKGLGLISDDRYIFRIECEKKIVESESDEGLDLTIYEYC